MPEGMGFLAGDCMTKHEKDYKTFDGFLRSLYGHCQNCGKRERNLYAPTCCDNPHIVACVDTKYLLHWHRELCVKRGRKSAEFKKGYWAGINKFAEKWRYLTTVSDRYWALGGEACFEEIMEKLRKTR